ncbi:hypothetical protein ONZ45_g2810 [Pleurotus djamor]|nr:hypothetical protein ONZ45_g2810 [Pleurotus djamor]
MGSSQLMNVTVDDQDGPQPEDSSVAIDYQGRWEDSGFNALKKGPNDSGLNGYQNTVHGTWKRSIYQRDDQQFAPPLARLRFNGTAVYVSCIISKSDKYNQLANSDMIFKLDSEILGNFTRPALEDGPAKITTVFQATNLKFGLHELEIQNGDLNSPYSYNVILLDAITFTGVGIDPGTAVSNASSSRSSGPTATYTHSPTSAHETSEPRPYKTTPLPITPNPGPQTSTSADAISTTTSALSSSSRATKPTIPIAGGVLGAVAGLVCIGLAIVAWRRYLNKPRNSITFNPLRFIPVKSQKTTEDLIGDVKRSSMDEVNGK